MKLIRKIAAFVAAGAMAAGMFAVTASADSILSATKTHNSGEAFTVKLNKRGEDHDYKIKLSKKGDLSISIKGPVHEVEVYLCDKDGDNIIPADKDISTKSGRISYYNTYGYTLCSWDSKKELLNGTITYKNLDKGTYYIRVTLSDYWVAKYSGTGKTTLKFTYPQAGGDDGGDKLDAIQIPMKKGDTMQLSAGADGAAWTSSDKSVVSVSGSGKITANKAGTATITAKLGGSSAKIKVKVA